MKDKKIKPYLSKQFSLKQKSSRNPDVVQEQEIPQFNYFDPGPARSTLGHYDSVLNESQEDLTIDTDLVARPAKKLDIAIIGYGAAGITAAIGLSRLGHKVTIYEKSFYNYRNKQQYT